MTASGVKIPVKGGDARFATGMSGVAELDVAGLERDLTAEVNGEVRFDTSSRALYATDSSNFRQVPIGVVIPRTVEAVIATHDICARYEAPLLARGCGTSLSGETVNYAVVLDFSKYLHQIGETDTSNRFVQVQPGAINEQVNLSTGKHGLVFAPDPSTHAYCTIGGNVGNNSCGMHSLQARFAGNGSRTSDNVHELDVLTYDGLRFTAGATDDDVFDTIVAAGGRRAQIYRDLRDLRDRYADEIRMKFPKIPRRVSGYNLDELLPENGFNVARALVGTEGTCVTVLGATLKLVPNPKERCLLVIGYDELVNVADHIQEILEYQPIACEAIDHELFRDQQQLHMNPAALSELPEGQAWVLVEFGGETREEAHHRAEQLATRLGKDKVSPEGLSIIEDREQEQKLWKAREGGLGATAFPPGRRDAWPGWEDSAVHPHDVGAYLRDLQTLYDRFGYEAAMYGHLGDGCIHSRINFDLRTPAGLADYRSFLEEAADLVASYHGSLSGEHGDGQQRAELLDRMYGPTLVDAFREFKRIWDPTWKMNPGKVVDPYRLDENLKLGVDYNPPRPDVEFSYRQDGGDFAHAALRCVGVGKCREPEGVDVMCPSFMVLREEQHTTRGRARLLFEMLEGDVITDGWRSQEVKDALDLCLACKGCTNDCPVNVDMPTYKAEFLHHHWRRRLRPRQAYAFGLIDRTAELATRVPRLANLVAHTQPFSRLLKRAGNVALDRDIPEFAPVSLQRWFAARGGSPSAPRRVLLWPDTFNNYFHVGVGIAAVEAIESAGWQVVMPDRHVCCGRPLYDYGFLKLARRYLRRTLDVLRPHLRAGTPVVGIEPSCLATFKHELVDLFPHDDDAVRLHDQACHFAEFYERFGIDPPPLQGHALVWGHCHHKATGGIDPETRLLEQMGLNVERITGGCCGLAGSWGFETEHHQLSMDIGEQALLPAVRHASRDSIIVADGFSCKTQIDSAHTGRRALHVAEVLRYAAHAGVIRGPYPEQTAALPPAAAAARDGFKPRS